MEMAYVSTHTLMACILGEIAGASLSVEPLWDEGNKETAAIFLLIIMTYR